MFRTEYAVVNVGQLAAARAARSPPRRSPRTAWSARGRLVKVLGDGELAKALTVVGPQVLQAARAKIEAAGGTLRGARVVIESFRNIFAIPDLRKRVLFTFALLAVYRLGCIIPTPGVDPRALLEFMKAAQGTFLGFVNTFTGGSLERVAVFALGIMPYITASIILQLLTVVWPYLEKLSKEGELGRKKITQYTRYGTVVMSIIQSLGIAFFLETHHRLRAARRWCPTRAGASA